MVLGGQGCNMNDKTYQTPPVPEKLREWLGLAVQAGASDLHLIADYPPVLRLHGDLIELSDPPLDGEVLHPLLWALCRPEAFARLQALKNLDFSFDLALHGVVSRFRANLFFNRQ